MSTRQARRRLVGYALKHVWTGRWWDGRRWVKCKANAKVYRCWRQADRDNDRVRDLLAEARRNWHVAECEVYA